MYSEPRWIDVEVPAGRLRALSWGPEDAPIALCLHGFPDTAYGWRKLAPQLHGAGYRVVAPFLRGYVPSSLPSDGSFHIGALMDDALRIREAAGPTDRDILIGHDWGAITASSLAAMPDNPFRRTVVMSVPPAAALRARDERAALLGKLPAQLLRSWYIMFFQLPGLPERSARWIVPLLWRRWSPGYPAAEDIRHVDAAIGAPERWRAALGVYRATFRNTKPPAHYARLHEFWTSAAPPAGPMLYLHGADDGCMTADFTHWVDKVLPAGSRSAVVEHAGHFLQLEQPQRVGELILDFAGAP
ncbi:alpha/beta fold hydrolase [[Mycobacterium] wendilense]|uniref:Alpha/beta fold hydrolase n=1 Tax=[Mycobacterium] wendilense TaxID=3064284 RepID=A0ABM9MAL9_9MYCO|nr:alpha/beta fold hydrolase [Mycolicibacterium sp. MU0050]CAJ1580534.1 alpha/beta fold hydrolase [Mycolicibacterium sp. MU0050]